MTTMIGEYLGHKKCLLTHESGASIQTDAPRDNGGEGLLFSPTDLVAAALGSCIMTIMGMYAERHGLDISNTTMQAAKEMVASPVRRIGRITITIDFSKISIPEAMRPALEKAGLACPVHQSLHHEIETVINFRYE